MHAHLPAASDAFIRVLLHYIRCQVVGRASCCYAAFHSYIQLLEALRWEHLHQQQTCQQRGSVLAIIRLDAVRSCIIGLALQQTLICNHAHQQKLQPLSSCLVCTLNILHYLDGDDSNNPAVCHMFHMQYSPWRVC
jgi:hypothetical protein